MMLRTQKRSRFSDARELNNLQRRRQQLLIRNILLLAIFLGLFVLGFNRVIDYEYDVTRSTFTIVGKMPIPVLEIRPAQGETRLVAIIAHGFFDSKDLMIGLGVELARAGVTAYLFDFPGHGESLVPFADQDLSQRAQQDNINTIGEVADYVRNHNSATKHPLLVLLGYSMGSVAIGHYSIAHANESDIVATILISPMGQEEPTQTQPKNLLMLVGQNDIPDAIMNSKQLLQRGCGLMTTPQGESKECGSPIEGTGRRFATLPFLNHIIILSASNTFQEVLNWLHRVNPQLVDTSHMQANTRIFWLLLGVVAVLLSLFPLSFLLIDIFDIGPLPRVSRGRDVLLFYICALPALATAIAIQYAWRPFSFLHLLLADYVSGSLFFTAIVVAALFFLIKRKLPIPLFRQTFKQLLLALVLAIFLYLTLGQLTTFAWQRLTLTLPRMWRCGVIFILLWPIFLIDEGISRGYQERHAFFAFLESLSFKGLLVVGFIAAIDTTPGLGFLDIVLPVLVLIFVWLAIFCSWLYGRGRAAIATATFSALVLAWAMSATFPLT